MKIRRQDSNLTLRGEVSVVFCPVTISSSYSCNAFANFVPFQNFRAEIRAKVFGCNRCDAYLSFEEVMRIAKMSDFLQGF